MQQKSKREKRIAIVLAIATLGIAAGAWYLLSRRPETTRYDIPPIPGIVQDTNTGKPETIPTLSSGEPPKQEYLPPLEELGYEDEEEPTLSEEPENFAISPLEAIIGMGDFRYGSLLGTLSGTRVEGTLTSEDKKHFQYTEDGKVVWDMEDLPEAIMEKYAEKFEQASGTPQVLEEFDFNKAETLILNGSRHLILSGNKGTLQIDTSKEGVESITYNLKKVDHTEVIIIAGKPCLYQSFLEVRDAYGHTHNEIPEDFLERHGSDEQPSVSEPIGVSITSWIMELPSWRGYGKVQHTEVAEDNLLSPSGKSDYSEIVFGHGEGLAVNQFYEGITSTGITIFPGASFDEQGNLTGAVRIEYLVRVIEINPQGERIVHQPQFQASRDFQFGLWNNPVSGAQEYRAIPLTQLNVQR